MKSTSLETLQAALLALDQIPRGGIEPSQVIPLLESDDNDLRHTASWLVARHPEWARELASWLQERLVALPEQSESANANSRTALLEGMLVTFSAHASVQELLSTSVKNPDLSSTARRVALSAMAHSKVDKTPAHWPEALAQVIEHLDPTLLSLGIAAALHCQTTEAAAAQLNQILKTVADNEQLSLLIRVQAIAAIRHDSEPLPEGRFTFLLSALTAEQPVTTRLLAADAISHSNLTNHQIDHLCEVIEFVGPLELHQLLEPFERSTDELLGLKLLSSLKQATSLSSLRVNELRERLAKYGPTVQQGIDELHALVHVDFASQQQRIAELLPQMENGDVRRGQAVFHSAKATCTACHKLGYTGGSIGPDLTRIGETRTERDLLEAILFPSLSFVRSYEPVEIIMTNGKTINGLIRNETPAEVIVATGPNQEARIRREEIEEMSPSTVSVMPAGLDKQFSIQELADLVAFLKNARAK